MSQKNTIAKNTTYLTLASIIQKVISFGYYAFLAAAIGEAQLGQYDAALKFTSVFIIFMDFGLGPLMTREIAKDESKLDEYFQKVLSIKFVLIFFSLAAMIISAGLWNEFSDNVDISDVWLILFGGLIIVLDTLTFTFFSIFRAKKELQWEAIGIIIYQATILGAGFTAISLDLPLMYILGALFSGSLVQFLYMGTMLLKKAKLEFHFTWDWQWVKQFLVLAAPFAFAGILFRLNGTADSLMLKTMAGNSAAGWYALAFKLAFALTVLPGAFATSYYPVMSDYYKNAKEKLHTVFEQGMVYMMAIGFPISAGVLVIADELIIRVWKQAYEASIEPLWILMIALPFIFFNYPIGNFLNAVDRQKLNTINMSIALLINIVLNALLIPLYTFNGAAIAATVSSIVLVALGLPWVYTVAPFRIGFLIKKTVLFGLSASIMAVSIFTVQNQFNTVILIIIGAVLYTGATIATTAITPAELKQLFGGVLRKFSRAK